jgi:hypothetical protein
MPENGGFERFSYDFGVFLMFFGVFVLPEASFLLKNGIY